MSFFTIRDLYLEFSLLIWSLGTLEGSDGVLRCGVEEWLTESRRKKMDGSQGRASTCTSFLLRDHADLTHNSYTARLELSR